MFVREVNFPLFHIGKLCSKTENSILTNRINVTKLSNCVDHDVMKVELFITIVNTRNYSYV